MLPDHDHASIRLCREGHPLTESTEYRRKITWVGDTLKELDADVSAVALRSAGLVGEA